MEEVVVTGECAGPGMWQVTHPDHPGHALWIVGEQLPLPKRLRFRSQNMERVALHWQEILLQPGVSLKPDLKVGVFRMLTLVLAAQALRKNPDKARLQDLVPGDPNRTDAQIAALPFDLYRQGYEYYWRTHAHPGSTFKYTMSSLLDLMRWDATDQIGLIDQPLLMIAGSKADSLYMSEGAFAKASGTKDKELFKIDGATHIETYWVPKFVEVALSKLTPFFARTL